MNYFDETSEGRGSRTKLPEWRKQRWCVFIEVVGYSGGNIVRSHQSRADEQDAWNPTGQAQVVPYAQFAVVSLWTVDFNSHIHSKTVVILV
jgi:hypothetical protein